MIFALAIILSLIVIIVSLIVVTFFKQGKELKTTETMLPLIEEPEESEPIEYDEWFYIERSFREKSNVLEVEEAHSYLQPNIDIMIEKNLNSEEIKSEVKVLIDEYFSIQIKIIANEVLTNYVEGYTKDEFNYLISLVDDSEMKEVLYLLEVQYLKSKGIVLE